MKSLNNILYDLEAAGDIHESLGGLYIKDLQGNYLYFNKYLLDYSGLHNKSDLTGKNDFELPWEHQASSLRSNDEMVIKTNKSIKFYEVIENINGEHIVHISHKKAFHHNGKLIGVSGMSVEAPKEIILNS